MNHTQVTRIKNDMNGNPRHVVHWLALEPETGRDKIREEMTLSERYERVLRAARRLGGRKFHNKTFGGGVVFQAYECEMQEIINRVQNSI